MKRDYQFYYFFSNATSVHNALYLFINLFYGSTKETKMYRVPLVV